MRSLGIEEVLIAPWQNPNCERVIGTLRRECLDHLVVRNAGHLRRVLACYLDYYHRSRPHQIPLTGPKVIAFSPGDNPVLGIPTPSRPGDEQQMARPGLRMQFSGPTGPPLRPPSIGYLGTPPASTRRGWIMRRDKWAQDDLPLRFVLNLTRSDSTRAL